MPARRMSQRLPSLAGNGSQLTGEGARGPLGLVTRPRVCDVGSGACGGDGGGWGWDAEGVTCKAPAQTALVLGAGLCREGQKPGREGPSLPWRPLAQGGVVPSGPCLGGPQAEEEKQPLRELRMGL